MKYLYRLFLLATFITGLTSCSDWLEPEPLSFYTPENGVKDVNGIETVLQVSRRQLKNEYYGNQDEQIAQIEYILSDMAISGAPEDYELHNLETQLTPTLIKGKQRVYKHFSHAWGGIKYANLVINRIPQIEASQEKKDELLAEGYFHLAYWYYRLVNQFGDVPLILEEIQEPRIDLQSTSREAILKYFCEKLEFAVEHLPMTAPAGAINRAAGEHLLTKYYLQCRRFDDAVKSATRCIENYGLKLMKNRFGIRANDQIHDVINDLFKEENITASENLEGILTVQEQFGSEGSVSPSEGSCRMRLYTPYWSGPQVRTPDGMGGYSKANAIVQMDSLGRGIGIVRPTNYYQYELWKDCGNDMRHNSLNWYDAKHYTYTNPQSAYFRKSIQPEYITGHDTIRCYYSWPYYKVFVDKDEINKGNEPKGGFTDWYVFRLAETYLLRAEAYYWQNKLSEALADVNEIRQRANAPLYQSVGLDEIFDERARELYLEEPRKCELTRVAYIKAALGQDGYTLDKMHEKNWYYDRVIAKNNFYRNEISHGTNSYKIKPYNVYWPIPQDAIDANNLNVINQNYGYQGSQNNIPPLETVVEPEK